MKLEERLSRFETRLLSLPEDVQTEFFQLVRGVLMLMGGQSKLPADVVDEFASIAMNVFGKIQQGRMNQLSLGTLLVTSAPNVARRVLGDLGIAAAG